MFWDLGPHSRNEICCFPLCSTVSSSDSALSRAVAHVHPLHGGGEEVQAFAKEVAAFLGNNLEDVLAVLSFYQLDDDPALDPAEVRGFLELYLA